MSHPNTPPDLVVLARAVRFAFVALVLCLSYFAVCTSLSIPGFEQIFRDMLANRPLPALTVFVIRARPVLLALSFLVPLLAVAILFSRRLVASFYLLGVLLLWSAVHFVLVSRGLFVPLISIVGGMSGNP